MPLPTITINGPTPDNTYVFGPTTYLMGASDGYFGTSNGAIRLGPKRFLVTWDEYTPDAHKAAVIDVDITNAAHMTFSTSFSDNLYAQGASGFAALDETHALCWGLGVAPGAKITGWSVYTVDQANTVITRSALQVAPGMTGPSADRPHGTPAGGPTKFAGPLINHQVPSTFGICSAVVAANEVVATKFAYVPEFITSSVWQSSDPIVLPTGDGVGWFVYPYNDGVMGTINGGPSQPIHRTFRVRRYLIADDGTVSYGPALIPPDHPPVDWPDHNYVSAAWVNADGSLGILRDDPLQQRVLSYPRFQIYRVTDDEFTLVTESTWPDPPYGKLLTPVPVVAGDADDSLYLYYTSLLSPTLFGGVNLYDGRLVYPAVIGTGTSREDNRFEILAINPFDGTQAFSKIVSTPARFDATLIQDDIFFNDMAVAFDRAGNGLILATEWTNKQAVGGPFVSQGRLMVIYFNGGGSEITATGGLKGTFVSFDP